MKAGSREVAGAIGIEPLERRITYRFGMVASRLTAAFAAGRLERHGLTVKTWRILAVIAACQPLSAKDLAERTATDPYHIARSLTALLGQGLISRDTDPDDRRRISLRLTPAGRRAHDEIAGALCRVERTVLDGLTGHERLTLFRLLDALDARIRDSLGGGDAEPAAGDRDANGSSGSSATKRTGRAKRAGATKSARAIKTQPPRRRAFRRATDS